MAGRELPGVSRHPARAARPGRERLSRRAACGRGARSPEAVPPIVDRDVAAVPGGVAAAEEGRPAGGGRSYLVGRGAGIARRGVSVRAHRPAFRRCGRGLRPRVAGWPAGRPERTRRPPDRRARGDPATRPTAPASGSSPMLTRSRSTWNARSSLWMP